MSARLAGLNSATCPHILQAIMALASGALETHEPSYIGKPAMSFLYMRHAGHRELQDAWQCRIPPLQGGGVWGRRTHGDDGALPSAEARSGASGRVAAPEPI
jgi:hypothetical protein